MKFHFLILFMLLLCNKIFAQLDIKAGTQFSITGNIQLTLVNTDLINNGNFSAGNSITSFKGNTSSFISGTQLTQFFALELNKTNNDSVILQHSIGVAQRILFSSGFLHLNGFNADLGTTGFLQNEKESSRVTGINGGEILFDTILNAPVAANPANLGAVITSTQNLGNVIIRRGHQSQVIGNGASNSLFRYYEIIPANNTNLNATLRFNYFDGELNGLDENKLVYYKSDDSTHWVIQGFTSNDPTINFVEKEAINSFSSWWTLSDFFSILPEHFISFNLQCNENSVSINWKTAQEQNSNYFNIERSVDAVHWSIIGNVHAAGNSANERNYFFTDNDPIENGYYRVSEHDANREIQYTKIIRSSCTTDKFKVWPNPVQYKVFIDIVTKNESQIWLRLFDSKGTLVKTQTTTVFPGSNEFNVDVASLASGIYTLQVVWKNGETKKSMLVIK